jgi:alkylated DNA repair protein (DNA oxidative demethylase)
MFSPPARDGAPGRRQVLRPGAVYCLGWLAVPSSAASLPGGHQMSVKTVCLGWHWQTNQCTRTAGNGQPASPFPGWLAAIGQEIIARRDGRSRLAAAARAALAATSRA